MTQIKGHVAGPADHTPSLKWEVAEYLNDTSMSHGKHQTATYVSVFFIVLSVAALILETKPSVMERYGDVIRTVDIIVSLIFTVEYLLRIWAATESPDDQPGWPGAVQYMKSLYGAIDLIAILPFFLGIMFPAIQIGYLRVFRLLRILLLARYFKSFSLIKRAIFGKKAEVIVSLQIVAVLTIILSVLMFEIEHAAHNPKFSDVPSALAWSIGKFIGGIGGYANFDPITSAGQIVATLIGLLGIALFAVPAGIIASGFKDEMEHDKKGKELEEKTTRLCDAFQHVNNRHLEVSAPRKYITLVQAKSRLNLTEEDIIAIARKHNGIRLRYKKVNSLDAYPNALLIENFIANTSYGTCKPSVDKKKGDIVVVAPNSYDETSIGHFAYCLSILLDATFISNEIFGSEDSVDPMARLPFSQNDTFALNRDKKEPVELHAALKAFKHDIREHINRGTLTIIVRSSEGIVKDPLAELKSRVADHAITSATFHALTQLDIDLFRLPPEHKHESRVWGEFRGRGIDDVHWFIQEVTGSTVMSLYIDPYILEWAELEEYYEVIRNLADSIKDVHLVQEALVIRNLIRPTVTSF